MKMYIIFELCILYHFVMAVPLEVQDLPAERPHVDQIQRKVVGGRAVDQGCLVLVHRRLGVGGARDGRRNWSSK